MVTCTKLNVECTFIYLVGDGTDFIDTSDNRFIANRRNYTTHHRLDKT